MPEITEIYPAIEGETSLAGFPITLVRLSRCNLRCAWCDTSYAYKQGLDMSIGAVIEEVEKYSLPRVLVTGGEPLMQDETCELIKCLCDTGRKVYVETNGTYDIDPIDERAIVRLDIKPPSSGMVDQFLDGNFGKVRDIDEVKIAIAGRDDYDWAFRIVLAQGLLKLCTVNLTPITGVLHPSSLAEWILESGLDFRLNLQTQKIVHGPNARSV